MREVSTIIKTKNKKPVLVYVQVWGRNHRMEIWTLEGKKRKNHATVSDARQWVKDKFKQPIRIEHPNLKRKGT